MRRFPDEQADRRGRFCSPVRFGRTGRSRWRHRPCREPHLHDPGFPARMRQGAPGGDDCLRDLRQARRDRPQCRAARPWFHQQPPCRRPLCGRQGSARIVRARAGLVGGAGRARARDRHRPAVRRVLQHAGLFVRLDQSGEPRSRDRETLWSGFPAHHARGYGACAAASITTRAASARQ